MSSLARLEKYFCSLLYNWLLKEKWATRTLGVERNHETLQDSRNTTRVRAQHPGWAGGHPTPSHPAATPLGLNQTTLLSTILDGVIRETKLKLIFGSTETLSQSSRMRQEKQVFRDKFWEEARQTSIRLPLHNSPTRKDITTSQTSGELLLQEPRNTHSWVWTASRCSRCPSTTTTAREKQAGTAAQPHSWVMKTLKQQLPVIWRTELLENITLHLCLQ